MSTSHHFQGSSARDAHKPFPNLLQEPWLLSFPLVSHLSFEMGQEYRSQGWSQSDHQQLEGSAGKARAACALSVLR